MRSIFFLLPVWLTATAVAQLPQIRLKSVFPPGAASGTSVDVAVAAGTDLDEVSELIFTHKGLAAVPKVDSQGKPITNQFTVSVGKDITPGLYDVRVRGLFGVSNPRIFRVDSLPEVVEAEPNNTTEQTQTVAINSIVNAKSNSAADVDAYRIDVKANQTIVLRCEAACLDSLMQPVLELFDAKQRRVAQDRRRKQTDAAIVYTSPTEQSLVLKIHDTVYAGSNDYGYRLIVDTRPLVDYVTPAIVQARVDTPVTLYGRHLPDGEPTDITMNGVKLLQQKVSINVGTESLNMVGADSATASTPSAIYSGIDGNLLSFALQKSAVPLTLEVEQDGPQTITLPTNIAGSFSRELDQDAYRFAANKDQSWQVEVFADRFGRQTDPVLIVEQVSIADDGKETLKRLSRTEVSKQNPGGNNLPTLTNDPNYTFRAPVDGTYQLRLMDRYGASRGGPDMTYSLSVREVQTDFRVVAFESMPSTDGKAPPGTGAISIRKGGTYELPVYVWRSGGLKAEIRLLSKGMPTGITLSGGVIPAGKSSTVVVLSAAADAPETLGRLELVAVSKQAEKAITNSIQVATLVHEGANGLPRTGRVSDALLVSILKDEEPIHVQPEIAAADVTQGQQLLIPIKLTRRAGFVEKVDLTFAGQPGNVDVPKVTIPKGQDSAVARFYFKENAGTGLATLRIYGTATVAYSRNPWKVARTKADLAEAVKLQQATQKTVADAKAAADAGTKKVTELVAMQQTLANDLKTVQAAKSKLQADLKTAVAAKVEATQQLVALQQQLNAAAANTNPTAEDFDAALKQVKEATTAVAEASKPAIELAAKLKALTTQVTAKEAEVTGKTKQIAEAQAAMEAQQQAVKKAQADMAAATAKVKQLEQTKKAATKAVTAAETAAKPQNKNVRVTAIPVALNVHAAPGKLTVAVPNGGAIKKGTSVDVKVTLTRLNKFPGPFKVSLHLPDGNKAVTSNTVDIPVDMTEAMLSLTASADAKPADVANAVIRATADFNGRQAAVDVPITLKVTD